MDEAQLRKTIINDLEGVKYLLLTAHSVKIMKGIIKRGSITAVQLSEFYGISVQNSSSQLKRLYFKGYLKRTETVLRSGGIEYIYKSVV